jgi:enoyl-CoA hydratase/carnithine racemase
MNDRITLSIEDGIATLLLNRPAKLNALDPAMFAALLEAGETLAGDASLRAVVIAGEGRAFCAGLDMQSFQRMGDSQGGTGVLDQPLTIRTHGISNAPQRIATVWRDVPVPVIAAVHGAAFGGGLQLALGADIRIVAPDAKMSVMEIKWGLVPDMAGIVLMRELARPDVVRELTYTGRQFTGEEALALARMIARQSPDAIRAAKRLLGLPTHDPAAVLMAESVEQQKLIGSPDQVEAVRANLENRLPAFR